MGFLTDLLKDLPLTAVLREKITTFENEIAALKQENASLKDDKRELQAENKRLKDEIKSLTHTVDLDDTEIKILVQLADPHRHHTAEGLRNQLQIHPTKLDYYLEGLEEKGYIRTPSLYVIDEPMNYYIDQKGREFLIKNNLI